MKIVRIFVLVVVVAFAAFAVAWLSASRSGDGDALVTVEVSPKDSKLYLNGKGIRADKMRLKPGEYVFIAQKDGYLEDRFKLNITKDSNELYVGLLPSPESEEAKVWVSDNYAERESIGGKAAYDRGDYIRENNPVINDLPYFSVAGPYKIDYGLSSTSSDAHPYLLITYSSPDGRKKALDWLRNKGHDPAFLDIRFSDFNNPLLPEEDD